MKRAFQTILLFSLYHVIQQSVVVIVGNNSITIRSTLLSAETPEVSDTAPDKATPNSHTSTLDEAGSKKQSTSKESQSNRRERIATEAHASFGRPPLASIVTANNTIIGNPEWLVDFGILGFGKCGTSTMMVWLKEHPEIQAFGRELGDLMQQQPGRFVRRFYEKLAAGPYIRGYKAPQDISQTHIIDYYRRYWPRAKLIIGIRHPVHWFESLYNFRIQNMPKHQTLPHPNKLIGGCVKGRYLTCTDKGNFGFQLLKLGLQNYPQPREANEIEKEILGRYPRAKMNITSFKPITNPVFLFDLEQLGDGNKTRTELFRQDMTKFIGLREALPPLPHRVPGQAHAAEEQARRNALKINICDEEFAPVRRDLMELSRSTSRWVLEVFLTHPNVVVSSRDFFIELMRRWGKDPCQTTQQ